MPHVIECTQCHLSSFYTKIKHSNHKSHESRTWFKRKIPFFVVNFALILIHKHKIFFMFAALLFDFVVYLRVVCYVSSDRCKWIRQEKLCSVCVWHDRQTEHWYRCSQWEQRDIILVSCTKQSNRKYSHLLTHRFEVCWFVYLATTHNIASQKVTHILSERKKKKRTKRGETFINNTVWTTRFSEPTAVHANNANNKLNRDDEKKFTMNWIREYRCFALFFFYLSVYKFVCFCFS